MRSFRIEIQITLEIVQGINSNITPPPLTNPLNAIFSFFRYCLISKRCLKMNNWFKRTNNNISAAERLLNSFPYIPLLSTYNLENLKHFKYRRRYFNSLGEEKKIFNLSFFERLVIFFWGKKYIKYYATVLIEF